MHLTYVHSVAAGGLLASVTLGKSLTIISKLQTPLEFRTYPVQGVSERILAEVVQDLALDLESGDVGYKAVSWLDFLRIPLLLTGLSDSLLGESLNFNRLVALSVQELVVDDLDAAVIGGEHADLVGDG